MAGRLRSQTGQFAFPDELVSALAERRVIPFVGAGFSAALGFPTWRELLSMVCNEVEGALPYEEVSAFTGGDPLQIAEYLYLKSHKEIGPLRHVIENNLPTVSPINSAAHVALANLGAPQVYTTNYDDLIESTFRDLDFDVNVVTLPRDVANAQSEVIQVVKYHGDLRHDRTLVLTESSYFRRLDFESPMDLKFRSDLLGRSVLFMGYSFKDINIRIIWFKLMQMMKDIPEDDRRPSYIVRLTPNPVLEELDRSVGLRTIVLNPEANVLTSEESSLLLAQFLDELALRASAPHGFIPGTGSAMFTSAQEIAKVKAQVERFVQTDRSDMIFGDSGPTFEALISRRVPPALLESIRPLYDDVLTQFDNTPSLSNIRFILHFARTFEHEGEYSPPLAEAILLSLFVGSGRKFVLASENIDWPQIYESTLSSKFLVRLRNRLRSEIQYHEEHSLDEDLAYVIDITRRVLEGKLIVEGVEEDQKTELRELVDQAAGMYPIAATYELNEGSPPDPGDLLDAIRERQAEAFTVTEES